MDTADYNFGHSIGAFAGTGKTGEVVESLDFVLGNSRGPAADFNQALLKRPEYKLERALDRMLVYYGSAGVPFRVHVRSQHTDAVKALEARGCEQHAPIPIMGWAGQQCVGPQVEGLEVMAVGDGAKLEDFQRVAFESFGFPVQLAPVGLTTELVKLPNITAFVGYVDSEPACCSLLLTTGRTAGIYWVGTLAHFRARGLGAAITAHAVEVGRHMGCQEAILQASEMGTPVYSRLGFKVLGHYACLTRATAH